MTDRRIILFLLLMACHGDDRKVSERPSRYGLGHTPTPAEIAAIDIDANASGVGLPAGQGTAATGAVIYAQKCASCHGPKGEGIDKNPKLIGREPPAGFIFATDAKAPKTIGNYWPYATTLYDYLHRAMPLNVPGSLTPDETYSLVAFLLSENGIIPATTTVDAKSLAAIKMPAQPHFVPDNRTGGATFK
jgi:mono/diheme cytochrome c family protein